MIDQNDLEAVKIMATKAEEIAAGIVDPCFDHFQAIKTLHHAIRHLAYPDRDIYPKVRSSRKGDPVVRTRQP